MHHLAGTPELLWRPSPEFVRSTNLADYMHWLGQTRNLSFDNYWDLHRWSVEHIEDFWESIYQYFSVGSDQYEAVLTSRQMPGGHWFPGAMVNFAEQVLRNAEPDAARTAIYHQSEGQSVQELSWEQLRDDVSRVASYLRSKGVGTGDMVAAYITNIPEAIIAFLATAAVGAVWSSCSPEFGVAAVQARFEQLRPKVLFAVDGYRFGGKHHDRRDAVRSFVESFPSLALVVHVPSALWEPSAKLVDAAVSWDEVIARVSGNLDYAATNFEDPLFVCFSSGTTGIPKAIVHGHGGITLETLKLHFLQENATRESRSFFYSTTGWIVWVSSVVSALITGGAIVIYDGNPLVPDPECLWRLAEATQMTSFGASPVYLNAVAETGFTPRAIYNLCSVRSVLLTGSPASPEITSWAARNIAEDVHVGNLSGGTDLATAIVGVCSILPAYAGEFQCPQLGVDAQAFTADGRLSGREVGELVILKPMPTMPLYLLNDPGDVRLKDSYYQAFPGIWHHGDFFQVTERGTSLILGRSDATLNRNGIRIGTAELYRILESIPGIADSLVVNLELSRERSFMPLFVQLAAGVSLDDGLKDLILTRLRADGSPRHVPDKILECPGIPYTISGKKLEVPVKRLLLGAKLKEVANIGSIRNPEDLLFFEKQLLT